MKTAYVSIDMDFWDNVRIAEKSLRKFLNSIPDVPLVAVMNHQQLVRHVNKIPADVLVNIDTHSDLVEESTVLELNCGTWVSYIKWRHEADYIWYHAHPVWQGNCNHTDTADSWNQGHGYKSAEEKRQLEKTSIQDMVSGLNVVGVGLCLSPFYINSFELEVLFRQLVKDYKIPYFKGDRSENIARQVRPPFRKTQRRRPLTPIVDNDPYRGITLAKYVDNQQGA